ncbi:hypothetical protein PM082_023817 [Marasmius tenuissimus]|nr:hypothetical protein PM082_023817 [Marasmius tenuissimus]
MLAQDGSNWKEFIRALKAYFRTQGNAKVLTESKPDTPATDLTEAVKNKYKTWQDQNEKCFRALQMRTYPIHDVILDSDSVIDCISNIKANYGSENTAELLNLYTNLHPVVFPSNQSPVAGINYMATQRHKFKAQDVGIPEALLVLMIIAKLPKSWANLKEYVIQLKKEGLKLSEIISITTNTWNARTGGHSGPEVYTAAYNAKISGVPKFKSAPNWSGQSGSSGNKSGGKPKGGNCSNQNNYQNQNQNYQNQQGSSKKKNNKKGKGKGKGKKQNKPRQGGQKSHVAALDAQQCSVLEAEFSQPQSVHMSIQDQIVLNAINDSIRTELASETVTY